LASDQGGPDLTTFLNVCCLIETRDGTTLVQGRIDILVIKDQLWVLVIESKGAEFSPKVGIPQSLSYMLATPQRGLPLYGLVTNGTDFVFLIQEGNNQGKFAYSSSSDSSPICTYSE
jgi:hypothetical protein